MRSRASPCCGAVGRSAESSCSGESPVTLTLAAGGFTTFLVCWGLVATLPWHGRFSLDAEQGIQRAHRTPTARIGGLGIAAGLLTVWSIAPSAWQSILGPVLLASGPALAFGLAEDLSKSVPAWVRLAATVGSGAIACTISGTALAHTGVPPLDSLLQGSWPLAVALTAVALGGVANAVNIMDGFNGLASGLVVLCACALGSIALQASDTPLAGVFFALATVAFGFLLLNFPLGKIFLGDGGAYLLGFMLAWLAVLLVERNPSVAPVAVLLVCAYPVIEVLFSVARRLRRSRSPMAPDQLHLHSLVHHRMARKRLAHRPLVMQNASVSPLLWLFAFMAAIPGVLFWDHAPAAWLGLGAFALGYWLVYRRLALFGWR